MRFEDVKKDMILIPNEESNRVYKWTAKNMGAIVKVIELLPESKAFKAVIVGSSVNGIVGIEAELLPEYFEEAPADLISKYKEANPKRIHKPSREAISALVDNMTIEQKIGMLLGML